MLKANHQSKRGKEWLVFVLAIGLLLCVFPATSWASGPDANATTGAVVPEDASSREAIPQLAISAHVADKGWLSPVGSEETAGTVGEGRRLEALSIYVLNEKGAVDASASSGVLVQAHVQNIGWQEWVGDGSCAGTTGQGLRLEALRIKLSDELAKHYDIWYRAHVQNFGWMAWSSNGEAVGSQGLAGRMEAIQATLLPKGSPAPSSNGGSVAFPFAEGTDLVYSVHAANIGWQPNVKNGQLAGTVGESRQLEALTLTIDSGEQGIGGGVQYRAHVQDTGWLDWTSNGAVAGTTGKGLRLEAIQIQLTGELARYFDVYYQAHTADVGWLGWASNGATAGSTGISRAIEAVRIELVFKGNGAPGSTDRPSVGPSTFRHQYTPAYYNQADSRWGSRYYGGMSFASTGCSPTSSAMAISGITGRSVTPPEVGDYLWYNTREFNRDGNSGASGSAIRLAAGNWGVPCQGIDGLSTLRDALSQGKIIVIAVGRGSFVFGNYTHAIVLFNKSGDNTYVYDPASSARNGWYSISGIWGQRSGDPYDWRGGYIGYAFG